MIDLYYLDYQRIIFTVTKLYNIM